MPVRRIKAGYSNLTAKVPSKKLSRFTDAESSLERDFLLLLEHDSNVISFEEQPLTIETANFSYTPDLLVNYKDSTILYEVKYRNELYKNWKKLKPKFKAAIKYTKEQNWRFKIITEVELRNDKLNNVQFLYHFSRTISPNESEIRQALIESLFTLPNATVQEVLALTFQCKINRAKAISSLWRLVYEGVIETDLTIPLSMQAKLTLSNNYTDGRW